MKPIRYILLLIMALLLVVPAGAQMPLPDPLASWFTVRVDTVEVTNSDPLTLTVTGQQTDNCSFPVIVNEESFNWGLRFNLERDFEAEDILCTEDGANFEAEIILTGAFTDEELAQGISIEINNYVGRLSVLGGDMPALQIVAYERTYSSVEQLVMTTSGLNVRGVHATGCTAPFVTRSMVDTTRQTIDVYLYRIESLALQACPAILLMYDTTLSLPDDLEGEYTINANNRQLVYDFDAGAVVADGERSPVLKSATLIDAVEVIVLESMPMQLQLKVTGSQPDGCDLPVIVTQQRADNVVLVEIYRELPIDTFCSMQLVPYEETISIEGDFTPGTYHISVNGTIVEVEL